MDNAWEQEKPEARKMLENAAESHTSGARFVGQPACLPERLLKKALPPSRRIFTRNAIFGNYQKFDLQERRLIKSQFIIQDLPKN